MTTTQDSPEDHKSTEHASDSFDKFNFTPTLADGLEAMGFFTPTPIQQKAIPLILNGHDLIACAQTGTGKTAAFLLPIMHQLVQEKLPNQSTKVLVLVPTRELAVQIDQQVEGLGYFTGVSSRAIFGGNDSDEWALQRKSLDQGADILIATPGRLIQFMQLGIAQLSAIHTLILDEADRMLDMGFLPDMKTIIGALPTKRQTLLFSATMPKKVRLLAQEILNNPQEVSIAPSRPAERIKQQKIRLHANEKVPLLTLYLKGRPELETVMIFAERKRNVRELARQLQRQKLSVAEMHSDLEQTDREQTLSLFKARLVRILVATDIVARGIDIDNVDLVVNFNVPHDPESYVHRVGRTARAAQDGEALTLVDETEERELAEIEKHLKYEIPEMTIPEGIDIQPRQKEETQTKKNDKKNTRNRTNRPKKRHKQHNKAAKNTPSNLQPSEQKNTKSSKSNKTSRQPRKPQNSPKHPSPTTPTQNTTQAPQSSPHPTQKDNHQ